MALTVVALRKQEAVHSKSLLYNFQTQGIRYSLWVLFFFNPKAFSLVYVLTSK